MTDSRPAVIFIGGSGRSGSTLLDRMIGQLPGHVSAGEIRDVWRAGVRENRLCGCGRPFDACEFWTRVGQLAFGGWSKVDAVEADRLMSAVGYRESLGRTTVDARRRDLVARLYGGISEAAGGATIIDSSKSPPHGAMLASILPGSVRAIHLVRDARGVAFSWAKHVRRPDTPGREVEMHRLGPAPVALRWMAHNAVMESLGRRVPSTRVRYESLLADPGAEVRRALAAIGAAHEEEAFAFLRDGMADLTADHTVMGNPMRMSVGSVALRPDIEWQARMGRAEKALVTALTWPLLLRYGYRL